MKTSNTEPEEKKCTLYDMILIAESVKTPWNELTEEQQKLWTPYVINRFISSREEYVGLVAMTDQYNLTPEQHYTLMCSIIDGRRKHYFNYKAYKTEKASDDDKLLIWACSKEYEIGAREAKSYIEQMPNDVKEQLKEKWEESYKYNKQ